MAELSAEGTEARYAQLIARLERAAAATPGRYKLQVFVLSMLGYVYLAVVLLAVVTIIGAGGVAVNFLSSQFAVQILAVKVGYKLLLPLLVLCG